MSLMTLFLENWVKSEISLRLTSIIIKMLNPSGEKKYPDI